MKSYAIYNITRGEILSIYRTKVEPPDITVGIDEAYEEVAFTVRADTHYINDLRVAVLKPEKPPERYWTWDWTSKNWIDTRSLTQHKDDKWQEIQRVRYTKLTEPLSTAYGTFDADMDNQNNIFHSLQYMQQVSTTNTNTTIVFSLHDNTTASFTTSQLADVVVALGDRTNQIYTISRDLRTSIYAATTSTDVDSIAWPT